MGAPIAQRSSRLSSCKQPWIRQYLRRADTTGPIYNIGRSRIIYKSAWNKRGGRRSDAFATTWSSSEPAKSFRRSWIQKRLRDLGYYFGSDDGVWGASSRSALRDFKAINGLQENDTWDKETEERLSSGQNIHPSGIFLGQWGLDIAQCQQFQHSSAPITIHSHHAETVGSVCNFRSIKREATNSWRIHAVCSADGNSWNANISLKLVGSKLSWSSERGTATYVRCPRELGTAMTGTRGGTPVHVGSR